MLVGINSIEDAQDLIVSAERGMRFPRVKQFYKKMFEIAHHAGRPILDCFMSSAAMRESPLDGYHYMNFGAGPLHYSGNEVEMGCNTDKEHFNTSVFCFACECHDENTHELFWGLLQEKFAN